MKYKRLLNILPLLFFPSLLVWINIRLAKQTAPAEVAKIFTYKYGDKISHVVVYGIFSFIILFFGDNLFSFVKNRIRFRIILATILFILITTEEFTQRYISTRSFSYTDLACSYIGFTAAVVFFLLIKNIGELIRLREKS